jgi:hypothetical protein
MSEDAVPGMADSDGPESVGSGGAGGRAAGLLSDAGSRSAQQGPDGGSDGLQDRRRWTMNLLGVQKKSDFAHDEPRYEKSKYLCLIF